jgi:hypothetical protein
MLYTEQPANEAGVTHITWRCDGSGLRLDRADAPEAPVASIWGGEDVELAALQ